MTGTQTENAEMPTIPQERGLGQRVRAIVEPAMTEMGFALVLVRAQEEKGHSVLQLLVEGADESPVTVDQCVAISHAVEPLLELHNPIAGAYRLEVSSPGLDRPLVRPSDYKRFAGEEAKLEIFPPLEGRKRFRGILRGLEGESVRLDTSEGPVALPYSSITQAKLLVNDAAIRAALRRKNNDAQQPASPPTPNNNT